MHTGFFCKKAYIKMKNLLPAMKTLAIIIS